MNDQKAEVTRITKAILPLISGQKSLQRFVKTFGATKGGNDYMRVIVSRFCFLEWSALMLHGGKSTSKGETLLLAFLSAFSALPFADTSTLISELYPKGLEKDLVVATMQAEGESVAIRYPLSALILRAIVNRNGDYVKTLRSTNDLTTTLFAVGNMIPGQIHEVLLSAPPANIAALGDYFRL